MQPSPGAMVTARLRLLAPLGEGAMGTVWVAEHLELGTRVAVKFVSSQGAQSDPASRQRLETEARAASRIDSDHVVQVLDHGTTDDGTPFLAMELLEGESLGERVRRAGPLPLADVASIVMQSAAALAAAHAVDIVHRDIKPDNLFLLDSPDGVRVKVLDFGFAKPIHLPAADGLTAPGMMVGTPKLISPDQLLDPRRVDPQRDLWALAVVAYYALTGHYPFDADPLPELLQKILIAETRPPSALVPELPAAIDAWFARAFQRDKKARFASAEEMAQRFAEAAGAPPSRAPASGDRPPISAPPSRARRSQSGDPAARARAVALASPAAIGEACRAELERTEDKARAARLLFEIARQAEAQGELEEALAHYRQALERLPHHLPALRGARRCLLRRGDLAAVELFDAEIRLTPGAHDKLALWLAKGHALEDLGGDPAAAAEAYAAAAALDPSDPRLLAALTRRAASEGDWPRVSELDARAAAGLAREDRYRAALLARRARIAEHHDGDGEAAVQLYAEAERSDPNSGAAAALERQLEARGAWSALADLLERRAAMGGDRRARASATIRAAQIRLERLDGREAAIAMLLDASESWPDDGLLLDELERIGELGDAATRARVLERRVTLASSKAERVDRMRRLGALYEASDPDQSAGWYEAALALEPANEPILRALERIYKQARAFEPLVRAYVAHAEALEDAKRRAHAEIQAAELLERLGEPERASRHYARALSLDPARADAFKALEGLHRQAGRYHELIELYARAVEQADDPEVAIAHLLRIGALYQERLDDPAAAIGVYRRILELAPEHQAAILALQSAAEQAGDGDVLVEALERGADATTSPERRLALRHRAAGLLGARGETEAALARYRRILEERADHAPTLASLEAIFEEQNRFEELAEALEQRLGTLTDPGARAAHLHRLGLLYEQRLGDDARAEARFRAALEADPRHAPAERALGALLARRGEHGQLVELLAQAIERASSDAERGRLAYRIGFVCEHRLGEPERAAEAYRRAIEHAPELGAAGRALVGVLGARGERGAQTEALGREAAEHEGAEAAALLLDAAGMVAASGTDDEAIAAYERVLAVQPDNLGALVALEPLYAKQEQHAELVSLYRSLARQLASPRAKVAALERLARALALGGAGDEERADTYRQILELDHQNQAALEGLEQLALAEGRSELLATVDRRFLAATRDRALAAAHGTRLAAALAERAPADAAEAFALALEREPDNLAAIRGLRAAAVRTGTAALEAEALRREAAWTQDRGRAAELLAESATLRSERLGEIDAAIEDVEEALRRLPDHAGAAELLEKLLRRTGETSRLMDRLAHAARSATGDEAKLRLWQSLARLRREVDDDVPGAIAALERCREIDPEHLPPLLMLADAYEAHAEWRKACDALELALARLPEAWDPTPLRLRLAGILGRHLERPAEALEQLAASEAGPAHRHEALALGRDLRRRIGDLEGARRDAAELASAPLAPAEQAAALEQLAQIEHERGDDEAARVAWCRAVELSGASGSAARALQRHVGPSWEHYAAALSSHLARVERGELGADPAPSHRELVRALSELERPRDALAAARRGLEHAPGDAALLLAVGDLLTRSGRPREAIEPLDRLLKSEPGRVAGWRALGRALTALGHQPAAALAYGASSWLETNDEELAAVARFQREPGAAQSGAFERGWLAAISPATDEAPLVGLLEVLGEALAKLAPLELSSWGLGRSDAVAETAPISATARRVAAAFGVDRFTFYLHAMNTPATVFADRTPILMAPEQLAQRAPAAQAFAIARAFVHHARGLAPALALDPGELERAVIAAVRTEVPSFGSGNDDELAALGKRLVKALARRRRKDLAEAATRYAGSPLEVRRWRTQAEQTAIRAAAVLAGHLGACLEALRAEDPALAGLTPAEAVQRSAVLADLLRFWMSERALGLRRHAGLLD